MQKVTDMTRLIVFLAAAASLAGCVSGYTLVSPQPVQVAKDSMRVKPNVAWNKAPKTMYDIAREETWTQNGPLLDSMTFIGALPAGEAIAKQRPKDDRKVPVFRPDMTPQDLASMVESYYRIKAGVTVFETTGVKPTTFLGKPGMQLDFAYVGGDEVKRKGRAVLAVIDSKLYLMSLDGTAVHYFDAALPEFESIVGTATL
jgi:hypothetical protein